MCADVDDRVMSQARQSCGSMREARGAVWPFSCDEAAESPIEQVTESPLQPMWNRIWYALAPLVSALGAYVLAPLFVDFLKQRLTQTY